MGLFSHDSEGTESPQMSGLKLLKDCPVCQTNFEQTDIRVVETHHNVHLLHITCSSCTHAILSLFAISQLGMSSLGMATDLSASDAERVLAAAPIHEDEVLMFHRFLSGKHTEARGIEDLLVTSTTHV